MAQTKQGEAEGGLSALPKSHHSSLLRYLRLFWTWRKQVMERLQYLTFLCKLLWISRHFEVKLGAEYFITHFITHQWTLCFPQLIAEKKRLQKKINQNHEGHICWKLSNMMVCIYQMNQEFPIYLISSSWSLVGIWIHLLLHIYKYICVCVRLKNLFCHLDTLYLSYTLLHSHLWSLLRLDVLNRSFILMLHRAWMWPGKWSAQH